MQEESSIYESLGDEKIKSIVTHFYKRVAQVPELRKLYPKDLAPAEERLYWFLLHVFGGPSTYLEKRGHPMLRRRHFQWQIDGTLRDKWLDCMNHAIDQVAMESKVRDSLSAYFLNAANHMVNR
ncbi:globin domain-containing protein [Lunatibacter salilacus]|uniref:globin domain-containing protein n=1 Tax=Lunatibacter salilacus TaxID=2483804 RepID=UPI00131DDDA4|nr:cyanoglobin [Lunatibacter salilacus]